MFSFYGKPLEDSEQIVLIVLRVDFSEQCGRGRSGVSD